jgi:NTE family protein
MARVKSPLDSQLVGSMTTSAAIEACTLPFPLPARPIPPAEGPAIAVALSGGGFRAALTAAGVLRFLADARLLERVRYVSAVSGGSITAGLVACAWPQLRASGFATAEYDRVVLRPLLERVTRDSLACALISNAWRVLGSPTRTDLFASFLDQWFYDGALLENLEPGVRFVFNAANLTTAVRFGFERDVVGDWVLGLVSTAGTRIRVADAVAASGAVPVFFNPKRLALDFPCARGRVAKLVDGGTYDNLGLEVVDDLPKACLISSNAGGLFTTGPISALPVVGNALRALDLLWRQTTALRSRVMVERFQAWEKARDANQPSPPWGRQGVLFGLATTMGERATPEWLAGRPEPSAADIANLALSTIGLGKVDADVAPGLIQRGWWLTGATLSRYHRHLLGPTLPVWQPF